MNQTRRAWLLRVGVAVGVLVAVVLYWLLPIRGQVTIAPDSAWAEPWPRWRISQDNGRGGAVTVQISDVVGWRYVLATVNGRPIPVQVWSTLTPGYSTWAFVLPTLPADQPAEVVFYHDCDTGCQRRSSFTLNAGVATPVSQALLPTKLGAVDASPSRNWHGRAGWDVALTYARLADQDYWGVDHLAWRVHQAQAAGLRVLVRVDYDQGQSLPPVDDAEAVADYLDYLRRLARDERLSSVYGYVLGSGYNELGSNSLDPQHAVTPAWYARLFNGYGLPAAQTDNAVQIVRAENPSVRLLVGPVRPWVTDQDGAQRATLDAPWLTYFQTLVSALDAGAQAKQAAGYALAAPDGFALHAPGRVGAWGAAEPQTDQPLAEWNGAQAGFRVYRDWLAVINSVPGTRGLPAFITSTNTFVAAEGIMPAQNYPPGWLAAALAEINAQPQVQALCWFLDADGSGDPRWDGFSLSAGQGRLADAATEFDALLRGP